MRSVTRIRMALAVLALAAACTDTPLAPSRPPGATPPATAPEGVSARDRQERLARQFALALNSPQLRQALLAELQRSPSPEKKVHFQALLAGHGGRFRRALAEAGGVPEEAISADALAAASLETYLPVPEHRARWRGADDLLVATAVADGDTPAAGPAGPGPGAGRATVRGALSKHRVLSAGGVRQRDTGAVNRRPLHDLRRAGMRCTTGDPQKNSGPRLGMLSNRLQRRV